MADEEWKRGRACARCYTQKLKCRRPPGQATCVRCARLNAQCRPRPPKAQTEQLGTIDPRVMHDLPGTQSKIDSFSLLLLTPESSSAADVSLDTTDIELNNLNGMDEWQDQAFFLPPMEQDLSNLETIEGITTPELHSRRSYTPERSPSLNTWVNNVARLNTSICSYCHDHNEMTQLDNTHAPQSDLEIACQMAMEFSDLVRLLRHTDGSALEAWHNPEEKQQVDRILDDTSNILLLTSAYGRLLGLFYAIIKRHRNYNTLPHIDLTVGTLDLGNRPGMQSFLIVNMIELLVQRIDRILESVSEGIPVDRSDRRRAYHEPDSRTATGLSLVLDMTKNQHVDLLKATGELRVQLLGASEW